MQFPDPNFNKIDRDSLPGVGVPIRVTCGNDVYEAIFSGFVPGDPNGTTKRARADRIWLRTSARTMVIYGYDRPRIEALGAASE